MERVLTDFVKTLRNANVQVSPAETLDAMEVIQNIGYEDRELLKNTLSLTLPKTPEEKEKFESCFEDFFQEKVSSQIDTYEEKEKQEQINTNFEKNELISNFLEGSSNDLDLQISKAGEEVEIREIKYFTQRSVFSRKILEAMGVSEIEEYLSRLNLDKTEEPSEEEKMLRSQLANLREKVSNYVQQQFLLHGDVRGEQLREQVFKSMNMGQIDRSYLNEVHSLVRKMAKKLANMHSRRKKNFRRGKLDIRKTIQDNWVNQGVLFNLRWSYKKIDKPKIIVVCDVSGSVGAYARFMLMFLFSLTEVVSKIRAFVFSSNLGEITEDFKTNTLENAIEGALSKYGGGSTDYSSALSDLVSICIDEIDKKTTVVILGDARNNFGPDKAELLKLVLSLIHI